MARGCICIYSRCCCICICTGTGTGAGTFGATLVSPRESVNVSVSNHMIWPIISSRDMFSYKYKKNVFLYEGVLQLLRTAQGTFKLSSTYMAAPKCQKNVCECE